MAPRVPSSNFGHEMSRIIAEYPVGTTLVLTLTFVWKNFFVQVGRGGTGY